MEKLKIHEIIVVEGKDDTRHLQEFFDVDTIETNGSAINQKIIAQIKHAAQVRGVIIFTDPDFAGEKIRKAIMNQVSCAKHAFLAKREAVPKSKTKGKSLGLEHASMAAIKQALQEVVTPVAKDYQSEITRELLSKLNLLDGKNSRIRRIAVSEMLHIGMPNAKQLLKRLVMFRISKARLLTAVKKLKN